MKKSGYKTPRYVTMTLWLTQLRTTKTFIRELGRLRDYDSQLCYAYSVLLKMYKKMNIALKQSDTPRQVEKKSAREPLRKPTLTESRRISRRCAMPKLTCLIPKPRKYSEISAPRSSDICIDA